MFSTRPRPTDTQREDSVGFARQGDGRLEMCVCVFILDFLKLTCADAPCCLRERLRLDIIQMIGRIVPWPNTCRGCGLAFLSEGRQIGLDVFFFFNQGAKRGWDDVSILGTPPPTNGFCFGFPYAPPNKTLCHVFARVSLRQNHSPGSVADPAGLENPKISSRGINLFTGSPEATCLGE